VSFLPESTFIRVRTLTGQSRLLGAAGCAEIDWRILICGRIFGWRHRGCGFLSPRSRGCLGALLRRRDWFGGILMLYSFQILGVGSRRRSHARRLTAGRGPSLFHFLGVGGRRLKYIVLLRHTGDAGGHQHYRECQRKSHPNHPISVPKCRRVCLTGRMPIAIRFMRFYHAKPVVAEKHSVKPK
jgi:hypothetical protein